MRTKLELIAQIVWGLACAVFCVAELAGYITFIVFDLPLSVVLGTLLAWALGAGLIDAIFHPDPD